MSIMPSIVRHLRGLGFAASGLALLVGFAAPAPAQTSDAAIARFSATGGTQPPAPWRFSGLPNKAATRFDVVELGGQRVLRVDADKSYGNLVHPVRMALGDATTLAWRWRVDEFVRDADLRVRSGDDGAAKVCVFFDFPADRLSLGERTRLAVARRVTGEDVPSEVLCYVWDEKQAKGTTLTNAFTNRMRMVVLESGRVGADGWVSERRSLLADYRRAFGDEAGGAMPDVVAVAISADADNTQGHGLAYFSDLSLRGSATMREAALPPPGRATQGE